MSDQRELHLVELSMEFDYEGSWDQIIGAFDDADDATAFADAVRAALPENAPAVKFHVHQFSIRRNFRHAPDPAYFGNQDIAYEHDEEAVTA